MEIDVLRDLLEENQNPDQMSIIQELIGVRIVRCVQISSLTFVVVVV